MLVRWLPLLQLPRYTMFPSSHSPTQMCEKSVSLWVVGQWVQYGLTGLRGGSTLALRSRISQFSPPDRSRPNPWEEYTKPASVATAARISRSHATVLRKDVTTAATKRASPSRPSGRRRIPSTPRKSSADSRAASGRQKNTARPLDRALPRRVRTDLTESKILQRLRHSPKKRSWQTTLTHLITPNRRNSQKGQDRSLEAEEQNVLTL
jgi:hypothetical protein